MKCVFLIYINLYKTNKKRRVDETRRRGCVRCGERKREKNYWGKPTNRETKLWCEGMCICVCVCVCVCVYVCVRVGSYRAYLFHLLHSFSSQLMAFPWGKREIPETTHCTGRLCCVHTGHNTLRRNRRLCRELHTACRKQNDVAFEKKKQEKKTVEWKW